MRHGETAAAKDLDEIVAGRAPAKMMEIDIRRASREKERNWAMPFFVWIWRLVR